MHSLCLFSVLPFYQPTQAVESAIHEVLLLQRLSFPHVTPFHGVSVDPRSNEVLIVMKLMDASVWQRLRAHGAAARVDAKRVLEWGAETVRWLRPPPLLLLPEVFGGSSTRAFGVRVLPRRPAG